MKDADTAAGYRPAQRVGLIAGLAIFALVLALPHPHGLSPAAWRTAAVALLMAVWWMTEALPIPATALLPLVLFPALGILNVEAASSPYANDLIFLFMGGFFIAMAMERWGLHRRIALSIVAAVGTGPQRLVLGFMLATAFLSMWISNTATTAMMLPIALAVGEMFRPEDHEGPFNFGIALMLGVAYASSIGGVATIIGTPPNAVLVGAVQELLGQQIGFVQWMAVGVPLAAVMLPATWLILVRWLYPAGRLAGDAAQVLQDERRRLGPMGPGERRVAFIFGLTVLAWLFRAPKAFGGFTIPGIQTFAPMIDDSTIAIGASVLLFLAPVNLRAGTFTLDWATARRIPWGVLLLFGGGLSLARAMDTSGLAAWIGSGLAGLGALPPVVLFALAALLFCILTELTSNTATSTMAMPVMAGVAVAVGLAPVSLMATAALACSMAFMLPVATPPNAIVFGSGYLTIPQMVRAGIVLELVGAALITATAVLLMPAAL